MLNRLRSPGPSPSMSAAKSSSCVSNRRFDESWSYADLWSLMVSWPRRETSYDSGPLCLLNPGSLISAGDEDENCCASCLEFEMEVCGGICLCSHPKF